MKITKFSAFSIHFALSLLIFGSLVAVMYFYWFPGDLFFMDGGWQGIKLVAMVDLVLGPALTLLLFKPGKPKLVLDMSLIAGLQIAALAYGFYTTSQQRIVALVYSDGNFNTVTYLENRIADQMLLAKGVEPVSLADFDQPSPLNLYTRPFDAKSFGEYLESIANDYPGQRERSDNYLSLPQFHSELTEHRLSKEDLELKYGLELVEELLQESGRSLDESIELYPFRARYQNGIAVFDTNEMQIVDILRGRKMEISVAEKRKASGETMQAESTKEP